MVFDFFFWYFQKIFEIFLQTTVKNRSFNITFHLIAIDNVYLFGHGESNGAIVDVPD